MVERLNRAALVLGVGTVASSVLGFPGPIQFRLVRLGGLAVAVLLVIGALAVVAARLGRRGLVAAAGVGLLAAAGLQLAQLGRDTNWLGGDGSTFSLLFSLGIGLTVVGLIPVSVPADLRERH
ncbi:MAG: hypothetical protein L0Y54_21385 [Sporichthyaceae bacterium]|nr:hypothetical protein [Sporichthyaceae bacterium]